MNLRNQWDVAPHSAGKPKHHAWGHLNLRHQSHILLLGVVLLFSGVVSAQEIRHSIPGLDGEVTIAYDSFGVPHIYATTPRDLFAAQGYVHAGARWWQMEWLRRTASGRLSEWVGAGTLERDITMRSLDLTGSAQRNLERLPQQSQTVLADYARGINAWVADRAPSQLALEYDLLSAAGVSVSVEPWQPLDSMRMQSLQALSFTEASLFTEMFKGYITDTAGAAISAMLLPPYPYDQHPIITEPGGVPAWQPQTQGQSLLPDRSVPDLSDIRADFTLTGSNSWVVSGARSVTGMPLLANDTHMSVRMPSFWYENGLHCMPVSAQCPYDVHGFSIAGGPGILIGHNAHIAWGMTTAQTDVGDFYTLALNPENPLEYRYNGAFVPMHTRTETIAVFNAEPHTFEARSTVFGPVLDTYQGLAVGAPVALHWVDLDRNRTISAMLLLNRAQDWDQFRAALSLFDIPALNFQYADVEGNIGYVLGGSIPARVDGHDGSVPVPGTDDTYRWAGYMADNPFVFNPAVGYIVTANNATIRPENYPVPVATFFDYGYRAARIEALITATPQHDVESFSAIQRDSHTPAADILLPALANLTFPDPRAQSAANWLLAWDRQSTQDSAQAALFNVFWSKVLLLGFDELPVYESAHSVYLMSLVIDAPLHPLWLNLDADLIGRDAVISRAFTEALLDMQEQFGEDRETWRWGDLHTVRFQPSLLALLPVDPQLAAQMTSLIPADGTFASVNVSSYDPRSSYAPDNIPSMRMILDLSDFDRSRIINSTGQNGDARSPNYGDQSVLWGAGDYRPHRYSRENIAQATENVWHILPQNGS